MDESQPGIEVPEPGRTRNWKRIGIYAALALVVVIIAALVWILTGPSICTCTNGGIFSNIVSSL